MQVVSGGRKCISIRREGLAARPTLGRAGPLLLCTRGRQVGRVAGGQAGFAMQIEVQVQSDAPAEPAAAGIGNMAKKSSSSSSCCNISSGGRSSAKCNQAAAGATMNGQNACAADLALPRRHSPQKMQTPPASPLLQVAPQPLLLLLGWWAAQPAGGPEGRPPPPHAWAPLLPPPPPAAGALRVRRHG